MPQKKRPARVRLDLTPEEREALLKAVDVFDAYLTEHAVPQRWRAYRRLMGTVTGAP